MVRFTENSQTADMIGTDTLSFAAPSVLQRSAVELDGGVQLGPPTSPLEVSTLLGATISVLTTNTPVLDDLPDEVLACAPSARKC